MQIFKWSNKAFSIQKALHTFNTPSLSMRILHQNRKDGIVKVRVQSLDDLWYLKGILTEGDLVKGRTYRRIRDDTKARADKGERVPITIALRVDSWEFAAYITRLRITGKIEAGPEDLISMGSYHTLEVKPDDVITIIKVQWKKWELDRLKDAIDAAKTPLVLIVGVEDGEAELGVVRSFGVDFPVRIAPTVAGKREVKDQEKGTREFNQEVAKKIDEVMKKEGINACIIAGPGFYKDNLMAHMKDKLPKVAEKCVLESAGCGGRVGIAEILKKGVVERIAKDSRVARESKAVERLFEEIGTDGLAVYGPDEVKTAIEYSAVKTLLLTDVYLRKGQNVDGIIKKTKAMRGDVMIISSEHDAGERLQGIGGIGAVLRFAIG